MYEYIKAIFESSLNRSVNCYFCPCKNCTTDELTNNKQGTLKDYSL